MKRLVIGISVAMAALSGRVTAQQPDVIYYRAAPPDAAGQGGGPVAGIRFEAPVDVLMAEPLDAAEPVTGAPYSADVTTEIVQALADGNRIERRVTSSVARDSQGRVRRTQRLAAIGPILPQGDVEIVTIHDPVAGTHYSLDAARKVAVRSPPMFTKRIAMAPVAAAHHGSVVPAGKADVPHTESLGTRQIEGVTAQGTRSTHTIAAGAIGNQAPIHIVGERWYAPELGVVVYSRRSDPRFGETIYRLENIVRAEPPAELFQLPADFTIEAGKPFGVPLP